MKYILYAFIVLFTHKICGQCTFVSGISSSGSTTACDTISISLSSTAAGNVWTTKSSFPGSVRVNPVSFVIANMAYMGTGYNGGYLNDFWQYDPANDVWTQVANFQGPSRSNASGFSILSKGYVCAGSTASNLYKDLWEYDPLQNSWSQKTDFPGEARYGAFSFVVNNKAYAGTGSNSSYNLVDMYCYDQANNSWSIIADFGGGARVYATGFAIGNKGYAGTGVGNGNPTNDFWEYNPASNQWASKSNVPSARMSAIGFASEKYGYIGFGNNSFGGYGDFYEYDTTANAWTTLPSSNVRSYGTGFIVNGIGYVCLGKNGPTGNDSYVNDVIEYRFPVSYLWNTGATTNSIAVNSNSSTTYSVNVNSHGGCVSSATQSVTINLSPQLSVTSGVICEGDSFLIVPSGAASYSITGGNFKVAPDTTDIYTVTGIALNGCSTSIQTRIEVKKLPKTEFIRTTSGCVNDTLRVRSNGFWKELSSQAAISRGYAASFTLGSKGYICAGNNNASGPVNDLWEYDPVSDVWSQKADLPADKRETPIGFAIGNKGYVGLGLEYNNFTALLDMWEYDPANNIWTQKASFPPLTGRYSAFAFVVQQQAYIGGGYNTDGDYMQDFWMFDPVVNQWTQKMDFMGGYRTNCYAFSIGQYGYAGGGMDVNGYSNNDLYRYDPALNSWAAMASLPGATRGYASAITIDSAAYVGFGIDYSVIGGNELNDLLEYIPAVNSWRRMAYLPSQKRNGMVAFAINKIGYFGFGYSNYQNDSSFFEFDPHGEYLWNTGSTQPYVKVINSGTYSVRISNGNGCAKRDSVAISCTLTDLEKINETDSKLLTVFPNPSQNKFSVSSAMPLEWVELRNTDGKILFRKEVYANEIDLSLPQLPAGLYWISTAAGSEIISLTGN